MAEHYHCGSQRTDHRHHNHPTFPERSTSILIAIPFIVCFSLFGIFNLVGGTILTVMSCKPQESLVILQKLIKNSDLKFESSIDPMRVVGIMLLLTGSLLVVIGIALGVTACRSVNKDQIRRFKDRTGTSSSGLPLYSLVDRSGRRASSSSSRALKNSRKKSLEKTVSPILEEESGEEESFDFERLEVDVHMDDQSKGAVRRDSPSLLIHNASSFPNESSKTTLNCLPWTLESGTQPATIAIEESFHKET